MWLLLTVSRRGAQRVDAAHVAHHAPTDVVDMVEVDRVVMGLAGSVTPAPADRDAGVAEIGDVVVGDLVEGAMSDPEPTAPQNRWRRSE